LHRLIEKKARATHKKMGGFFFEYIKILKLEVLSGGGVHTSRKNLKKEVMLGVDQTNG